MKSRDGKRIALRVGSHQGRKVDGNVPANELMEIDGEVFVRCTAKAAMRPSDHTQSD